jgi:ABC-type transporter Mla subunit MlaD
VVQVVGARVSPPAQIGLRAALKTLPPLVKDLGPAASALAGPHDTELLGTVRGVAATFAAVAQSENNLARFVQSSSSSFAALNVDSDRPLDATIAALPDTLADLHVGQRALTSILDAADPLAQELRPGLKQLPAALRDADPLLVAGQPALSEAVPLIRELRAALSSAVQATPPARTLLAAIHPSLDVLNNSLLNALTRNTRVGLPAYLALINALQGGDGAFENFQTPAQGHQPGAIGAGHFVNFQGRFYTGYPTPTLPSCSLFSALPASIGAALQSYGLCTP